MGQLTKIVILLIRHERLAKPTDIRMIERLQNADLPPERLELVFMVIVTMTAATAVVAVPGCGGCGGGRGRADLVPVYDLDGEPFARLARHGFHYGGKSAAAELVRHVVVRVDAGQLERRQVPVDVPVVFHRVLLRHRGAERNLVAVPQDARLSPRHAHSVDL